ncbi:hypothetical protein HID58_066328 [Brassica napus]|uniref:Uncharacterized protein n=1 Tax=Brassica napus TaxID=3708 RepID=A0ABQ7ZFM1_BRANA|nr:hypothetical protein HID58_066328 [Brassica napus]
MPVFNDIFVYDNNDQAGFVYLVMQANVDLGPDHEMSVPQPLIATISSLSFC